MPLERAIGKAIIRGLLGSDLSANAIINIARTQGGGYRRKEMLSDIRSGRGLLQQQENFTKLHPDTVIPKSYFTQSEFDYDAKYRIHGNAQFYNPDTDQWFTQRKTMYTNDFMDKQGWAKQFDEQFAGGYDQEGMLYMGFEVVGAEHNSLLPY